MLTFSVLTAVLVGCSPLSPPLPDGGASNHGTILDDGIDGAVVGLPTLFDAGELRLLAYVKYQGTRYAKQFVQFLRPGATLTGAAVQLDFSDVTVANAPTVYDADGAPVSS